MIGIRLQGGAIDLAVSKPPQRNVIGRDSEPAIEKLPMMRSVLMLSPAGNRVMLPLGDGSGNSWVNSEDSPFALRVQNEKLKKGFLPFNRCPQTLGVPELLPEHVRNKAACTSGADGKSLGTSLRPNPCACIVETEKYRMAKNEKAMVDIERRSKSKDVKEIELRERHIEAIEKQNSLLVDGKKKA